MNLHLFVSLHDDFKFVPPFEYNRLKTDQVAFSSLRFLLLFHPRQNLIYNKSIASDFTQLWNHRDKFSVPVVGWFMTEFCTRNGHYPRNSTERMKLNLICLLHYFHFLFIASELNWNRKRDNVVKSPGKRLPVSKNFMYQSV